MKFVVSTDIDICYLVGVALAALGDPEESSRSRFQIEDIPKIVYIRY